MSQPTRTIDKVVDYVLNDKAGQVGDRYVVATGVGCHPSSFKEQSRSDRRRAKKLKGYVEGYALVQGFGKHELDPTNPEDWERANELGVAFGKTIAGGRPFIVVTQLDGKSGCLHNHIIISSVHPVTGRSFDSSLVTHGVLARTHDTVLAANGFTQTTELKAHRQLHDSTKKIEMRANGQYIWTDDLTARVEAALADARSIDEESFYTVLAEHGVDVGPNPDRSTRNWTFGMNDAEKTNDDGQPVYRRARGSRLAAHLTRPAINQQLAQNERLARQPVVTAPVPAPAVAVQQDAPETTEEINARLFGGAVNLSAPASDEEQASAATPTMPTKGVVDEAPPVSAPAPAEEEPYVSPLRRLRFKKPDPELEAMRVGLADFDEETRARLAAGQRPVEAHVPKGVGSRVLDVWGAYVDPAVLAQLELRQAKKKARSDAFEVGRDLSAELKAMRAAGKQWSDAFETKVTQRDVANRRRERLEHEFAAGCYEDVGEAMKAWKDAHPEVVKFDAKDREDYVQRGQVALDEALEHAQRDRQVCA